MVEPTLLAKLEERTAAVLEERKVLLEIEPVYGAYVLLLAGSIDLTGSPLVVETRKSFDHLLPSSEVALEGQQLILGAEAQLPSGVDLLDPSVEKRGRRDCLSRSESAINRSKTSARSRISRTHGVGWTILKTPFTAVVML